MRQKLNLVTLGVDNMERAIQFYEGLGWKKSAASVESLAVFPLGGITLCLHPRHELAKDAQLPNGKPEFAGLTLSFNAKSEAEVDEVMREVAGLGASIIKPAQKVYWGGYSGYFKDLDGHVIEVAYNPFWPFDDNDNLKL